jgi:transcriptional regulator with XRE-family HTH domain/tetratricopeptide (TPR) repeat protein
VVRVTVAFGDLLRRHRLAADLTQSGLAELAGLSEQAVSLLERGTRRRPRAETLQALSAALKLSSDAEEEFFAAVKTPAEPPRRPVAHSQSIPWELPQTVADFTAREGELEKVLETLGSTGSAGVRLVITGMGGVGKTALAVHAGHLTEDRFPDGQLYVALRGYDPGSAPTSAEALGQLLRSLGVQHNAIPAGVDEMAKLYRSRIAGRRMLILLDDAMSVDQVSPLLPGDSGSAAIITSRQFLATLPGSLIVRLSAMTSTDSMRLLSNVAGESRVGSDEPAARELTHLTGGLPLALRLIGARLTARPGWQLQHFVDQLQDERRRLDELGLDHSGVRATFAASLNELLNSPRAVDQEAANAFDLLSLADGPQISAPLVARLLDQDERITEGLLERLVDLHLLDSLGPSQYRMHDLLRAYSAERLSAEERATERRDAIERGLRYYVAASWQAQRITHPWSPRQPTEEPDPAGGSSFPTGAEALGWIDAEYDSILSLFRQALAVPGLAQRFGPSLTLGLFGYLEARGHWMRLRSLYDLTLAAADPAADPIALGWLHHDRAIPDVEQGHLDAARAGMLRALELFEAADDIVAMARCCSSLSHLGELHDQLDEAIEWGERGRTLAEKAGDLTALGTNYLVLGMLYNRVGRSAEAEAAFRASFDLAERSGHGRPLARRLLNAGRSYLAVGVLDRAIEHLTAAQALFTSGIDDPVGLAVTFEFRSKAEFALGNYVEAERYALAGIEVSEQQGDRYQEGTLLARLAAIQDVTAKPAAARQARLQAIEIFEAEGVTAAADDLRKELLATPPDGDK